MTWEKKRVLVTVKAYPEITKSHGQTVCTAGITDAGEWIRLYPMDFSLFRGPDRIKRYDWIEVECQKAREKLGRKESHKVRNGSVRIVDRSISGSNSKGRAPWDERNEIVLPKISPSIEYLYEQYKKDKTSLGLIKPVDLIKFYTKGKLEQPPESREYQLSLDQQKIPIIDVIPHIFTYDFRCSGCMDGHIHHILCEDWELFESYRSWWKHYPDVSVLWKKMHEKFFDYMLKQDLYFYMGMYSLQPTWLIIGLYYPPKKSPGLEQWM